MDGLISKRHMDDIASAIRLKTGKSDPISMERIPWIISMLGGSPMQIEERSSDQSLGVISDSALTAIADAIREARGTEGPIAPSQMADEILAIDRIGAFDVIGESTKIARYSLNNTGSGYNTRSSTYDRYAYYYVAGNVPCGYYLDSTQDSNANSMLDVLVPHIYPKLYLKVRSNGYRGIWNTSTIWFRSEFGVTGRFGGNYPGENLRNPVTLTRYEGTVEQTNSQAGVVIHSTDMYSLSEQVVEIDISGITRDFYIGLHRCDNRTVITAMVAAWDGFNMQAYLGG